MHLVGTPEDPERERGLDERPVRQVQPRALVRQGVFVVPTVVRLPEGIRERVEGYVHRSARPFGVGELSLLRLSDRVRVRVEHHVEVQRQGLAQDAAHHAAVHRPRRSQRGIKQRVHAEDGDPVKVLHERELGKREVVLHVLLVVP